MLIFGAPQVGVTYKPRPGAYAIIQRDDGDILAVRTQHGIELPGGGLEKGEDPTAALAREMIEETGRRVLASYPFVFARQWFERPEENGFYLKHCTFFWARVSEVLQDPVEPDHEPYWTTADQVVGHTVEEIQSWALEQALKGRCPDLSI
ncbi:NUDIX domain-containing protein [Rhodovibrionaceae bacterium A322]